MEHRRRMNPRWLLLLLLLLLLFVLVVVVLLQLPTLVAGCNIALVGSGERKPLVVVVIPVEAGAREGQDGSQPRIMDPIVGLSKCSSRQTGKHLRF